MDILQTIIDCSLFFMINAVDLARALSGAFIEVLLRPPR